MLPGGHLSLWEPDRTAGQAPLPFAKSNDSASLKIFCLLRSTAKDATLMSNLCLEMKKHGVGAISLSGAAEPWSPFRCRFFSKNVSLRHLFMQREGSSFFGEAAKNSSRFNGFCLPCPPSLCSHPLWDCTLLGLLYLASIVIGTGCHGRKDLCSEQHDSLFFVRITPKARVRK